MFNKSRPVPSKAALRALYQLAYISSGTAVGVATLCAEERRRKTRLLQAVAENAKRLRDSPRHVHNAALAAVSAANEGGSSLSRNGDSANSSQSGSQRRKRRTGMQGEHRGEKDADLPSQVARGYAQMQSHEQRIVVRHASAHTAASERVHASETPAALNLTRVSGNKKLRQLPSPKQTSDTIFASWDTRAPAEVYGTSGLRRKRRPKKELYATLHSLAAAKLDHNVASVATATVEADRLHTEQFFESLPWGKEHQQAELDAADNFLRAALQRRDVPSVRSLLLLRFASNASGPYVARPQVLFDILVTHLKEPVDRDTQSDSDLFATLYDFFTTGRISRLPGSLQLELCLELSESIMVRSGIDAHALSATNPFVSVWQGYQNSDQYDTTKVLADISTVVHKRLKVRDYERVIRLLDEWYAYSGSCPTQLLDKTFSHALNQKRLVLCSHLLQQRVLYSEFCDTVKNQYELFIKACHCRDLEHVLISHFEHLHGRTDIMNEITTMLGADAQAILARAGARGQDLVADATQLYKDTISGHTNDVISGLQLSMHLRRKWRRTRDISAVQDHFAAFQQLAAQDEIAHGAFQPVLLAMVEIWAEAAQNDRSLEMLGIISRQGQDSLESVCAAATVLARKRSWSHLEKLMSMVLDGSMGELNRTTARSLHETLHQYSLHHTARETWNFANELLVKCQSSELKVLCNRRMLDIMLQCFVRHGELAYIHNWLNHIRGFGVKVTFNERSAANLMTTYYLEHRPPHALLMGICHDLVEQNGFKDRKPFIEIIKESLGYDMRHPTGNPSKMPYLRKLVAMNAELLERTIDAIPKPLQKWDLISTVEMEEEELSAETQDDLFDEEFFSQRTQPSEDHELKQPDDMILHAKSSSSDIEQLVQEHDITLSPDFAELQADDMLSSDEEYRYDPLDDGVRTVADMLHHRVERQNLERDMVFALSQKHFDRVLELYETSLDSSQLPLSPRILEIAVEACLQNTPDSTEAAEILLARARDAGMHSTCAQGPMLLRELNSWSKSDKKNPSKLRKRILDYYESNARHGWRVQHHVATHAANLLINHNRAAHGINLLNAIHQPDRATDGASKKQMNITVMSVYLKGYAMLRHEDGIRWAISYVLQSDLRIDVTFLNTLRNVSRILSQSRALQDHRPTAKLVDQLRSVRMVCSKKRMAQKKASGALGWRLVKCLTQCSRQFSLANMTITELPVPRQQQPEQTTEMFDTRPQRAIMVGA